MNTKFFRLVISSTVTTFALGCSDATQFAEQVLPPESMMDTHESSIDPTREQPEKVQSTESRGPTDPTKTAELPSLDPTSNRPGDIFNGGDRLDPDTGKNSEPEDNAGQSTQALFSTCSSSNAAIVSDVYSIPTDSVRIPDFSALTSVDNVCVKQLNITDRAFTEGFPEIPELIEWFGLDMRFRVYIPAQGAYTFTLRSDDGSALWIDNNLTIDNDGLHAVRQKSTIINLSQGYHSFHLKYFQGPRYRIALELLWKQPGSSISSYIPTQYLARP